MKIKTENYVIESDSYGYSLTVTVPSTSVKSKTGFTSKKTFHANLSQVAEKMMNYEIDISDAESVSALAEFVQVQASLLAQALREFE